MDLTHYKQFWRGELSLGQAFWIMYFGISFALGFAVILLMFVASVFKTDLLIIIIYFGGVIVIAAYTLWAAVGMWRCSPFHTRDGKRSIFWPLVVKVIIVVASISAVSTLIDVVKHPQEMVTPARPATTPEFP